MRGTDGVSKRWSDSGKEKRMERNKREYEVLGKNGPGDAYHLQSKKNLEIKVESKMELQ